MKTKIFTFILALVAGVGTIFATEGALNGVFSISATRQVNFSQGNLQYRAIDNIWQFAEKQTDFVGEDNVYIPEDYTGWIDLFGWGTGNNPTLTTTVFSDYATFTDWGTNAISNGGNTVNQWRTLTKDEWVYLFYGRTNAATKFGLGSVNGVNGTILLPDNWELPAGAEFIASTTQGLADQGGFYYDENNEHFTDNAYTTGQWAAMEANGAVFLPAAGRRIGSGGDGFGGCGYYWLSSPDEEDDEAAYGFEFGPRNLIPQGRPSRYYGFSVRLIQDIEVNYNLRLNGQYVTSKNCSDIASHISGITKVNPEAPSQLAYDEETNTLTMQNVKLTTSDVTWAVFNQIDGLTIEVLDTCVLHTPYCIALRTDNNLTIRGANSNAYLKVLNDGPLDHQIGTIYAGTCYTALTTFNSASLTIEDCTVQAEGAGGIKAQGSSLITLKRVNLTAKVIGTPTSDAQRNVMYTFLANVEPVLIDCGPISPEGLAFSSSLGGYAVNGELTRDEIEIASQSKKWTDGVLPGKFSVAADRQVNFSQGNLQYRAIDNIWQFAKKQTDFVGEDNVYIPEDYTGWIDLFGWGTGNNPTLTTTVFSDYATFTDWGTNAISNGGNTVNQWRTLTKDEWVYLFYGRTNAATLFALGRVNGVNGTILLPDNWELPAGAEFIASTTQGLADQGGFYYDENNEHFTDNAYTTGQWAAMEANGAVFLPAAGRRIGSGGDGFGGCGYYWLSSPDEEDDEAAYGFEFGPRNLIPQGRPSRYYGFSVRLVKAPEGLEGINQIQNGQLLDCKFIKDGQLFIRHGDALYNVQGARVR